MLIPSLEDWLPEGHVAWFVVEIVEQLDLRYLRKSNGGRGSQPYTPAMLVVLLFYGYAVDVLSRHKLECSTYDFMAFRYIGVDSHPDHDTIANFRKRFLKELSGLFVQILLVFHQTGVLKLGTLSIDGSKVKAKASKHKALSHEDACKLEGQLKSEVAQLLKQAEAADEADIANGFSMPVELERRERRLAAIYDAKYSIS